MAVYSSQMGGGPAAGGLYRKLKENRAKLQAIPEGKGAIGTMTRNLVEEPIERPVAPGAKKVVGIKPSEATGFSRGILPQESASAGQVAGPASMGMLAPAGGASRIAPRVSSNKAGAVTPSKGVSGGAVNTPSTVSIKPKTVSTGSTAKATLPNTGVSTKAPSLPYTGGNLIAGPEEKSKKVEGKKNASEQEKRAATTTMNPLQGGLRTITQSVNKLISNPKVEAPKAAEGIKQRVVKTVTNIVGGKNTYQKKILGFIRSLFGFS